MGISTHSSLITSYRRKYISYIAISETFADRIFTGVVSYPSHVCTAI